MPDFSKMKISELIDFAEEQAEKERQTPSLLDVNSPARDATWSDTLDILRTMKERGVPESLQDR